MSEPALRSDRTLIVSVVEYFGRETIRPECSVSRLFADLLGQKNLTRANVEAIKALGYVIKTKETVL